MNDTYKIIYISGVRTPLWVYASSHIQCVTLNHRPLVYVDGVKYKPDLLRWAQQRKSVRDELERRGITVLSGLTELNEKTMRSVAWNDMQRYINGDE